MDDNISSGRITFRIETTKAFRKEWKEKVIDPMFEKWIQECINSGLIPESAVIKKEE